MHKASISDILKGDHPRYEIDQDATIADAIAVMKDSHTNSLLVRSTESDQLGILSEHDIVKAFTREGDNANTAHIEDFMTHDVISIHEDEPIDSAIQLMIEKKIRHLPVKSSDSNIVGYISLMELLRVQAGLRS